MFLERLLTGDATPFREPDVGAWWSAHRAAHGDVGSTIERAILGGLRADRVGFAFVAGYRAALQSLVPDLADDALVALAATEASGNRPRDIATALRDGRVHGRKTWITLGALADVFLVVVSVGADAQGRNRVRVARVPRDRAGVSLVPMPDPPFVPEVPHAELVLDGVAVDDADLLPGDGYDAYLKPFRTVEDLHVHGALVGFLIGVARRHGWPRERIDELVALAASARALVAEPPLAASTHVAVAGLLALAHAVLERVEPCWSITDPETRARWERDRAILSVAGKAREARRSSAWARVSP